MILQELKKLQLKSEVVSIERSCHDEEITGIILNAHENYVLMCEYSHDGDFDGYSLFKTEQITELLWGNREHRAIAELITEPLQKPCKFNSSEFLDIINEICENHAHICIHAEHTEDSFDIGEIISQDQDWLKIQTFGLKKSLSRTSKLLLKESISRIVFESPYQLKIVRLHNLGL